MSFLFGMSKHINNGATPATGAWSSSPTWTTTAPTQPRRAKRNQPLDG
ncbi:hypothetical protein [Baekduia alba]|nr:hypothetical protein [Baekduia alba]